MSDNKNTQDGRDRARVDSKDASEVEYLHSQFPEKSHEEIKIAIEKFGPVRKDIEEKLRR